MQPIDIPNAESGNQIPDNAPYTIYELIDHRNRKLYEAISARATVRLTKSDSPSWGAKLQGAEAIIYCSESLHPAASLTHELLHIRHDLDGMSCPGFLPRAATHAQLHDLTVRIQGQAPYLYNQLIHHRFFPEFISLGFPADQFLHDGDDDAPGEGDADPKKNLELLKDIHRKSGRPIPLRTLILPYFYFASPHLEASKRTARLKEFRKISGNQIYMIDELLRHLKEDAKPDMKWYMGRLFYLCDLVDVGVGYDDTKLVWSSGCAGEEPPSRTGQPPVTAAPLA
jgi:hypothetical protein